MQLHRLKVDILVRIDSWAILSVFCDPSTIYFSVHIQLVFCYKCVCVRVRVRAWMCMCVCDRRESALG
jgi:hypothetical protein